MADSPLPPDNPSPSPSDSPPLAAPASSPGGAAAPSPLGGPGPSPVPPAPLRPEETAVAAPATGAEAPAFQPDALVAGVYNLAENLKSEIGKVIVGQEEAVELALIAMLASGHVLLEGVPGLAKTLLVRTLSETLQVEFRRIQFTPDLMPSDVVGTTIYDMQAGQFQLRHGPIFTHLLLADEINRTPPKTQSALLEAMEERQVSIDGTTHSLPIPFMVFATQNPVEYEGTYPLPEAQLDRFMMKILIGYPNAMQEEAILRQHHQGFNTRRLADAGIQPQANPGLLQLCQGAIGRVTVDDPILTYMTTVIRRTRESPQITLGASPRAGVALLEASKVAAAIRGRAFVIPDDVKSLVRPILRHRIILRPEAEIEGISPDRVLDGIVSRVEVPR